jgi:hypothetical protein
MLDLAELLVGQAPLAHLLDLLLELLVHDLLQLLQGARVVLFQLLDGILKHHLLIDELFQHAVDDLGRLLGALRLGKAFHAAQAVEGHLHDLVVEDRPAVDPGADADAQTAAIDEARLLRPARRRDRVGRRQRRDRGRRQLRRRPWRRPRVGELRARQPR